MVASNQELRETFKSAGATYVLFQEEIASKIVASYIFEPDVAEYLEDLLASAREREDYDIQEYRVVPGNPFIKMNYDDAFYRMREEFNCILIGLAREVEGETVIYKNPDDKDLVIKRNDYLIIITSSKTAEELQERFLVHAGSIAAK
jgi:voltage-gated potassium channel